MSHQVVLGHGIDIVLIDRIDALLREEGESLLAAYLTELEIELAMKGSPDTRSRFLAGRIAAKEAVSKALGTGISGDMSWVDIEIPVNEAGTPMVNLRGDALATARKLGAATWFVSITHAGPFAIASAIAVGSSHD